MKKILYGLILALAGSVYMLDAKDARALAQATKTVCPEHFKDMSVDFNQRMKEIEASKVDASVKASNFKCLAKTYKQQAAKYQKLGNVAAAQKAKAQFKQAMTKYEMYTKTSAKK